MPSSSMCSIASKRRGAPPRSPSSNTTPWLRCCCLPTGKWTWPCWRWDWAGGWMPSIWSMPMSAWCVRSASIIAIGWAIPWRPSARKRPASSAALGRRCWAPRRCRAASTPPSSSWAPSPSSPSATSAGKCRQARTRRSAGPTTACTASSRICPPPRLAGAIQYRNAATALAAVESLARVADPQQRWPALSRERIAVALAGVTVAGRFQILPGPVEWILDVSHNEPAAQILKDNLAARPIKGRTFAVCGILQDKDAGEIARVLAAAADVWIACALPGPRGGTAAQLAARLAPSIRVAEQAAIGGRGLRAGPHAGAARGSGAGVRQLQHCDCGAGVASSTLRRC